MKILIVIPALLALCGCSHQDARVSADNPAPKISDHFHEESARTLACLDGLNQLEISSDAVFAQANARCVEHVSYVEQIGKTDEEKAVSAKLRKLRGQIDVCHSLARVSVDKFRKCLAERNNLRDELGAQSPR